MYNDLSMKIFAKKGTNEKVVIQCPRQWIRETMIQLNTTELGNWVYVDELKPGEGIKFSDSQIYHGFHPEIQRYTNAIINIKP